MTRRRVAVVGGGVIGASIAWHLGRVLPASEVVLLDTHLPLIGATAYSAGILRRHHTLPSDVELAGRSLQRYQRFAAEVGGDCGYQPSGLLVIVGERHADDAAVHQKEVDGWGSTTLFLDAGELRARFPGMAVRDGEVGVLEWDGGYGSPARTAVSYREAFAALGGECCLGVEVGRVRPEGAAWVLDTNIGPLEVNGVILAAGAAARSLTAPLGLDVPVTPRRIGLAVTRDRSETVSALPVVIDDVTGTYFVPRRDGTTAIGVRARPECSTVLPAQPLTGEEITEALDRGRRRVPRFADVDVVGSQAACDGYTPDLRPVLGPVASLAGLHLAVGFSGGGFKIAPVVGEEIAQAVVDGRPSASLEPYALDRFSEGRQLASAKPYDHL